jgi:multidrug resistance efflux pump
MANLSDAVRKYRSAQSAVSDLESQTVEARAEVERARAELAEAIIDAARSGVRQVDIQRISGYSRERIRLILRAGGIEP